MGASVVSGVMRYLMLDVGLQPFSQDEVFKKLFKITTKKDGEKGRLLRALLKMANQ